MKEGRKKARLNKQQGKATQHTQGSMYMLPVALPCCLFDLACFFLPYFSHLSLKHDIVHSLLDWFQLHLNTTSSILHTTSFSARARHRYAGSLIALFPGRSVGGEKTAWYRLFAHGNEASSLTVTCAFNYRVLGQGMGLCYLLTQQSFYQTSTA